MGPTKFTTSLPFAKTARGRIAIDECLRVLVHPEEDHGPATPAEVAEIPFKTPFQTLKNPLVLHPMRCMHAQQPQPCATASSDQAVDSDFIECALQHRAMLHAPASEEHFVACAVRQVQQGTKDDHHETRYDAFEPLQGVYALGDCCANVKTPLPSLAQVTFKHAFILHGILCCGRFLSACPLTPCMATPEGCAGWCGCMRTNWAR